MAIRRKIKRYDYEAWPLTAWNACVDLLALERLENLTPLQADASHLFWYDSEVHNGGHFQYLVNKGMDRAISTVAALDRLGASNQRRILTEAIQIWNSRVRGPIETVDEFCDEAVTGEFRSIDRAYYACKPNATTILREILKTHFTEFIELD